jgi:hypothetical protein
LIHYHKMLEIVVILAVMLDRVQEVVVEEVLIMQI